MKEFLNYTLLQLGNYEIKVSSLMAFLAFVVMIMLLLKLIKQVIHKTKRIDAAKKFTIYSLVKYFILVFAFLLSMQILGFNISVLVAGSAALLVGIGLGLQNLFSDFVSGIILLAESSVKVDDVLDVNGLICKVQTINLRTTTVLTRDDKYIILPNTDLTRNQLINWTHSDIASRFEVTVGVEYASDVKQVMQLLTRAAGMQELILKDPVPFARFNDYGDSALHFSVYFWSEEVFRVENIKSDLRIKIFELFAENKIKIPFPQRVVHIKN